MGPARIAVLVCASLATLTACAKEEGQTAPKAEPTPATAPSGHAESKSVVPVMAGTAAAPSDPSGAPVPEPKQEHAAIAPAPPPAEEAAAKQQPDRTGCGERPLWLDLSRCERDGFLYATGAVSGVKDLGLARSAAADRARRALAKRSRVNKELRGSEVIDVYACKGRTSALARIAKPESSSAVFPACNAEKVASRSKAGACPEWTQRVAWKQEGRLSAVGVAKLKNRSLAEAAAANRARAELARLGAVASRASEDGAAHVSSSEASGAWSEVSKKHASCNGYVFVMLEASASQ